MRHADTLRCDGLLLGTDEGTDFESGRFDWLSSMGTGYARTASFMTAPLGILQVPATHADAVTDGTGVNRSGSVASAGQSDVHEAAAVRGGDRETTGVVQDVGSHSDAGPASADAAAFATAPVKLNFRSYMALMSGTPMPGQDGDMDWQVVHADKGWKHVWVVGTKHVSPEAHDDAQGASGTVVADGEPGSAHADPSSGEDAPWWLANESQDVKDAWWLVNGGGAQQAQAHEHGLTPAQVEVARSETVTRQDGERVFVHPEFG